MKYKSGVVADDITGANDIGIMYTSNGLKSDVYFHGASDFSHNGDVIILDTDSRFDTYENAYKKAFDATKYLMEVGVNQYFNKTCSVFRGNIGAEFDAMLDALGEDFAVVVLGFPDNGRRTVKSIHYVHGQLLEESNFKNDPLNPMRESNLVDILQSQTKRKVGCLHYPILDKGVDAAKKEIESMRLKYNYVIFDVRNNDDLVTIGKVVKDEKVICGASAIARELGKYIPISVKGTVIPPAKTSGKGLISISGSLTPQTKEQIEYIKSTNIRLMEMNTRLILGGDKDNYIGKFITRAIEETEAGNDLLVYSSNKPDQVKETKELGSHLGMTDVEVSRLVSNSLAKICKTVMEHIGQNRVLVSGGDTSASFCKEFGINTMTVYKEVSPGLPSCISLNKNPLFMILKSGSFGEETFFEKAIEHLKSN